MPVQEMKLAIMEIQESHCAKDFSSKVLDVLGKSLNCQEMMSLLSSKLSALEALNKEEEKVTDDCIEYVGDQPQNQVDPYDKAKDLIDQFRDRMQLLQQKQKSKIQYFKENLQL